MRACRLTLSLSPLWRGDALRCLAPLPLGRGRDSRRRRGRVRGPTPPNLTASPA